MLRQLAVAVAWEVYIVSFFLRELPAIDAPLRKAETYGHLGAAIAAIPGASVMNVPGLVVALVAALVAFAIRFHDRISDILGIRRRFDRDRILLPLAQLVEVNLTSAQKVRLMSKRHSVMRDVFYKYTSSRAEKPLVDKHDIEHALGAWFWFWLLEEASAVLLLLSIVAFFFGGPRLGWCLVGLAVLFVVLAFLQHRRLPHHARTEIEAIANDYNARVAVQKTFNAL